MKEEETQASDRQAFYRSLPKSDLHTHSAFAAPISVFRQWNSDFQDPPDRFFGLPDFLRYGDTHVLSLFRTFGEEIFRATTRAAFEQLRDDGVVYSEMSFDIRYLQSVSLDRFLAILGEEIQRIAPSVIVSPELGIPREALPDSWRDIASRAFASHLFDGIDLYGDELHCPVTPFRDFFREVEKAGARRKLHTGEIGDAKRVIAEIRELSPTAIQHGIGAASDPDVMQEIRERNIPLHVCPASNIALSIVEKYEVHPIRVLYDAGIQVTINTDDFTVFQVTLSEEYRRLEERGVFTRDELMEIAERGVGLQQERGNAIEGAEGFRK